MKLKLESRFWDLAAVLVLLVLLMVVVLVYSPALKGGFIFDDYPNLEAMGFYGGVTDIETFKSFVFNGFSGPLGRPVSLASFLIDDNNWPSNPESFKETNLKIHLLTGLMLIWCTIKLLKFYPHLLDGSQIIWVALISGAIWMLHPYMLSTAMYVVQRMAQLAALFVLAGLTGYLHGRWLMHIGKITAGYLWMTASICIGCGLAVLSKENGILLPLLICSVELCLPRETASLNVWWKVVFLWAPVVLVFAGLAKTIDFAPEAWPNRLYTQPERILTEGRILIEYLYNLYVPKIEGRGLFQDGYAFSRSLFAPASTFIAWLLVAALVIVALKLRFSYPFFSLAILFFFAGHVLESTVLCLELYFEHRNYLPSVFLFLMLAVFMVTLAKKVAKWVPVTGCTTLLLLLSFLTWERAKLWSDTDALQLYWAASTPESPRAHNKIAVAMLNAGNKAEAIQYIDNAALALPDSSFVNITALLIKLHVSAVTPADFERSSKVITSQAFDAQTVVGVRRLVDDVLSKDKKNDLLLPTLRYLEAIESNQVFSRVSVFARVTPYLKGKLYLAMHEYDKAYEEFNSAINLYGETDAALSMVAEMANAGKPVEAIMLLKSAEFVFQGQSDSSLVRSRKVYEQEFARLKQVLESDLNALGVSVVDETKSP